jgi:transcriptional regulator with XRE-family HTH domain
MTIADRLRRMLDERGFSISEAAREAGMEKQQVHRIVSGKNENPGVKTVERIVSAMGGTMAELFADPD